MLRMMGGSPDDEQAHRCHEASNSPDCNQFESDHADQSQQHHHNTD
jgi:hypothetical protein